jgi:hypothetical protein
LTDDGISGAFADELKDLSTSLVKLYSERLGKKPLERPTFYITWSNREITSGRWQADAVPGSVIRFGLSGNGWANPDEKLLASFREVTAHEIAHFWNSQLFDARGTPSWLTEGSAELLAISALLAVGKLDAANAASRIEAAASECYLLAGDRAWSSIRERNYGRSPYACGLLMHFGIVASARKEEPNLETFSFYSALWNQFPKYSEAAVVSFFKSRNHAEIAQQIEQMLKDPNAVFRTASSTLISQGGVAMTAPEELPESSRASFGARVLSTLMEPDCQGSHGFFWRTDHFEVSGVTGCANFKTGMKIRYVEDRDLVQAPVEAVERARAVCSQGGNLALKTLNDEKIALRCNVETAMRLPRVAAYAKFWNSDATRKGVGEILGGPS